MYIKKILWAIAIIGLIIFGVIAYFIYGAMFQPNTAFSNDKAYIYIPTDANYTHVREQLKPLLKDMGTFDALASQKKYTANIKAGRFVISKGMNNNEIINSIRSQNLPVKIAFNNQHNLEDLAGRISKQIEADSTSLIAAMTDTAFLNENGFNQATALGMYLPDTYEFYWNTSAKGFRDKMLKAYQKFWNEDRMAKATALNLSPNEVMTVASIVYEESKQKEEQPRVAGVYLNRLRIGMKLDADPTLKFAAYQLPKYKNTVIRRVLNVHKEIDSPYNTYKNAGLPPGLIAMPDLSAIDAVLNPEKHGYYYFAVDVKRPGYHKFAKSLQQHNVNARAYQRYLSSQGINR
ncbi:endolytic transglycosylase MltG [Winogradskyella sp.]|uniref:endolytic transglycosylase MltG n=1 Tax=Winogradskyella sp. TaxID=1883156 RepID=UPI003BA8AFB7